MIAHLCHVFHCLCFASTSWSSRGPSHAHAKTLQVRNDELYQEAGFSHLCQGDVASVRERSDDQTVSASQVLVLVVKVHIRDSNHHLLQVSFEVEPKSKLT